MRDGQCINSVLLKVGSFDVDSDVKMTLIKLHIV